MTNEYAVFILSHGRPDKQKTLNMLLESGFKKDIFIICDSEDKTLGEYKEKYGKRVIVFDKSDYVSKVDTIDNFTDTRTVVYARNACFDIAKDKGYSNFVMMDDDVIRLKFRYEADGKLAFKHVSNYEVLFDKIVHFQNGAGMNTVGFGLPFDFIGGLGSNFLKGFTRVVYCVYFLRTDKPHAFAGRMAEDLNHSWLMQNIGELMYSITTVQIDTDPIAETDGGFHDLYKSYGDSFKYMQVIYALITRPDSVSMGYNKSGIMRKKNLTTMYPLVISEGWKK